MANLWTSTVSTESRKTEIFMPYQARGKKRMEPSSSQLCPVTKGEGHKWEWGRLTCSSIGPSSWSSWKWGWLFFPPAFRHFSQLPPSIKDYQELPCNDICQLPQPSWVHPSHQGLWTYGCRVCFSIPWPNPLPPRGLQDNFFILVFNWKWYICLLATRWCLSDSSNAVQVLTRTYLLK